MPASTNNISTWGAYSTGEFRYLLRRYFAKFEASRDVISFDYVFGVECIPRDVITGISTERSFGICPIIRFHHDQIPDFEQQAGYTIFPYVYFWTASLDPILKALHDLGYPILRAPN